MDEPQITRHFKLHQAILRELGVSLPPGAKVLDFGCGKGEMVQEYARQGFRAFGCDPRCAQESPSLKRLEAPDFRLPFAENSFTFVFSDQVMEHVQDHFAANAEIARVLEPGGVSLHIFPARWKPLESHVRVPFAGVRQERWWLSAWARLGVRTSAQRGLSNREVTTRNYNYLQTRTNYLTHKELLAAFGPHFAEVKCVEHLLLKHTYGGARLLRPWAQKLRLIARLYAAFYSRAIFARKHS